MEEKLRSKLSDLAAAHGGQRGLAAELEVSQSTISRFLSGQSELTSTLARAIVRRYPGLKPEVEAVFFGRNMHKRQAAIASA